MNITVWNENVQEKRPEDEKVREMHPEGIHATIQKIVAEVKGANIKVATLDQPEAGLTQEILDNTDVLIWWAHVAHDEVPDEIVERVHKRVLNGMGFIALHSAHHSKIFKKLMGTTCDLRWRDDVFERVFCINPSHPIAKDIPPYFELKREECYGELFDIPEPEEIIFLGWYDIGEVFRSGCTWKRGYGKIFYFQPGHETNPSYYNPHIAKIIQNACIWAMPQVYREIAGAEKIEITLEEKREK